MSPSEYQELVEFLGRQFTTIDERFALIQGNFREFRAEVRAEFGGLRAAFGESRSELREFKQDVLGHFDEIYRRLERLDQEYHAIVEALRRIEAAMADDRGRREIVERDLAVLKQRVAALEVQIEALQRRLEG